MHIENIHICVHILAYSHTYMHMYIVHTPVCKTMRMKRQNTKMKHSSQMKMICVNECSVPC